MKKQAAAAFRCGGCLCLMPGKRKYGLQKNAFLHAVPTGIHVKYYRAALCLYQIEKQEKTKKLGGDRT